MNPLYAELQWLPRVPKDFDFNARLKALQRSTSTGPAGRELQSLASYALDLSQLAKLAKVIGRVRVEAQAGQSGGRSLEPLAPFRLAMLSNSTIDLIVAGTCDERGAAWNRA